jgi:hypothetical protein
VYHATPNKRKKYPKTNVNRRVGDIGHYNIIVTVLEGEK